MRGFEYLLFNTPWEKVGCMQFRLRQGPWETVFKGIFQGHELEVLRNSEELLLSVIYEKEGNEVTGALLQAFAVFHAAGEVQGFVESLDSEAVALSRHDGKNTMHFVAVLSKPDYSKMQEEQASAAADELIEQVKQRAAMLLDIAKVYELQLTQLQFCPESVRQGFFSQPLIMPLFARLQGEAVEEKAVMPSGAGTVVLGVTRGEKPVREPLQLFQRTIVEGTAGQALHFVHLIVEAALLANTTAVIFDDAAHFRGLCNPNKSVAELQRYKVAIEPVGFPVKNFNAAEHLWVDLNSVSGKGMLQAFGCGSATTELVEKGLEKGGVKSIEGLIESIEAAGSDSPSFEAEKAKRVTKLIDLQYPGLFNGGNQLQEVVKGWVRGIGRASIIATSALDGRALCLLVNGFLNELLAFSRKKSWGTEMNALFVLPNADRVFPRRQTELSKDSVKALQQLQSHGVGFAATVKKFIDLDPEVVKLADARAGIVKENDAAVQLRGKKNYRVLLRPGLSEDSELVK